MPALITFEAAVSSVRSGRDDDALYRLAAQALVAEEALRTVAVGPRRAQQEAVARDQLASIVRQIAATGACSRVGQAIKLQLAIQLYGADLVESGGDSRPAPVPDLLQSLLVDLTER